MKNKKDKEGALSLVFQKPKTDDPNGTLSSNGCKSTHVVITMAQIIANIPTIVHK